mgnify:CR=1 FL=1
MLSVCSDLRLKTESQQHEGLQTRRQERNSGARPNDRGNGNRTYRSTTSHSSNDVLCAHLDRAVREGPVWAERTEAAYLLAPMPIQIHKHTARFYRPGGMATFSRVCAVQPAPKPQAVQSGFDVVALPPKDQEP